MRGSRRVRAVWRCARRRFSPQASSVAPAAASSFSEVS